MIDEKARFVKEWVVEGGPLFFYFLIVSISNSNH